MHLDQWTPEQIQAAKVAAFFFVISIIIGFRLIEREMRR